MTTTFNSDPVRAILAERAMQAVVRATEEVVEVGNRLIGSPPKTGRIYRRRGVVHQASAPGQPPASDTGALIASSSTSYQLDFDAARGRANWSAQYAIMLELGTGKMEPRPFARPAVDVVAPSFLSYVQEAFGVGGSIRLAR